MEQKKIFSEKFLDELNRDSAKKLAELGVEPTPEVVAALDRMGISQMKKVISVFKTDIPGDDVAW